MGLVNVTIVIIAAMTWGVLQVAVVERLFSHIEKGTRRRSVVPKSAELGSHF